MSMVPAELLVAGVQDLDGVAVGDGDDFAGDVGDSQPRTERK